MTSKKLECIVALQAKHELQQTRMDLKLQPALCQLANKQINKQQEEGGGGGPAFCKHRFTNMQDNLNLFFVCFFLFPHENGRRPSQKVSGVCQIARAGRRGGGGGHHGFTRIDLQSGILLTPPPRTASPVDALGAARCCFRRSPHRLPAAA